MRGEIDSVSDTSHIQSRFHTPTQQLGSVKRTKLAKPANTMLSISLVTFVRASSINDTCAATALIDRKGMLEPESTAVASEISATSVVSGTLSSDGVSCSAGPSNSETCGCHV